MKKIIILLFLLALCVSCIKAQNLAPNPSFENYTECPDTSLLQFHAILDSTWYEYGSSDYFNACDLSNYQGVPTNIIGFQNAHSGDAYAGFVGYHSAIILDREYLEIQLSNSLMNGQIYYVQFYVSLADTMQYAIENIGALFTDTLFDPYPPPSFAWVTGVPQIENTSGNMLGDKINWIAINGSFVASGGEQYITIGNFRDDASTVTQFIGGGGSGNLAAYYYIDDVYVGVTPPPVGVEELTEKHVMKLYPNPNNGNMTLECNLQANESGVLNIMDIRGKLIHQYPLASETKIITIDALFLKAGMYVYELLVNGKPLKKDKLTVIK